MALAKRLFNTPLRDLARGRISGRLDWRARLVETNLPATAANLVQRVVRRTRLWRVEKTQIIDELAAHFMDAMEVGKSIDAVIQAFGDEKQAAKLIRRSKIRNRPFLWHGLRWLRGLLAVLATLYVLLTLRFFLSHPRPMVDYFAQLNGRIAGVSEGNKAWKTYQKVYEALYVDDKVGKWADYPDDRDWPKARPWLQRHAADLELLRQATSRPFLGLTYAPRGRIPENDRIEGASYPPPAPGSANDSLLNLSLPYSLMVRRFALILSVDAKQALLDRDSDLLYRDITATLDLADQIRRADQLFVGHYAALACNDFALDAIDRVLWTDASCLGDQQLINLAHRLSAPQSAADLLTFRDDKMVFHDLVQRAYSDDGNGNGHLTAHGLRLILWLEAEPSDRPAGDGTKFSFYLVGPRSMLTGISRRDLLLEYDRAIDQIDFDLGVPMRDIGRKTPADAAIQLKTVADFHLADFVADYDFAPVAERYLGRRDGAVTAIALELYRRHHNTYPKRLDDLVPAFLPEVPADRITGDPIKYRIVDGRPLLYSVGADRIDDGGKIGDYLAARWNLTPDKIRKGDWILFGPYAPTLEPKNP